jgi:hypothetical protein
LAGLLPRPPADPGGDDDEGNDSQLKGVQGESFRIVADLGGGGAGSA